MRMRKMYDVVIIGGGMSGIVLAIYLKQHNINACIIEANQKIGKKILASGNGKCNILNEHLSLDKYNNDFPKDTLQNNGYKSLLNFYSNLGLKLRVDKEGRVYPYSESANTVLNVFLDQIAKLNIDIFTNEKALSISKQNNSFEVKTGDSSYFGASIVLASGSNASFGINSHAIIAQFGHKATRLEQSLVPIKINALKGCNGVRSKANASLFVNGKLITTRSGELLFKDNALSGILAFELSSFISREKVRNDGIDAYIEIDFMPEYGEDEINDFIDNSSLAHPLTGLLHKAIALNFEDSENMAYDIKHYKCKVLGLMGLDNAQVLSGGLETKDFNAKTFESKLCENLYAVGEVLDVDGECGGYNLSFAASSALSAAKAIIEKKCK